MAKDNEVTVMHKATDIQRAQAQSLIARLESLADSQQIDSRHWLAAIFAKGELEGWLHVATERGETRQTFRQRIDSARSRFSEYRADVPDWLCHESAQEFVAIHA